MKIRAEVNNSPKRWSQSSIRRLGRKHVCRSYNKSTEYDPMSSRCNWKFRSLLNLNHHGYFRITTLIRPTGFGYARLPKINIRWTSPCREKQKEPIWQDILEIHDA